MGGRKKPSISQLEKRARREGKGKKKDDKKKVEMEFNAQGELTDISVDHIIKDIKKMKYITPYILHTRFGLKISRAKKVLRQLEEQGVVKAYDKNHRVPIYVPAA